MAAATGFADLPPPESPFVNTRQILLDYQKTWIADKSPVKICEKSARIGISWATALEATLTAAASKDAGGMDVWYVSYKQESAEEFLRDVEMWAKFLGAAGKKLGCTIVDDEDGDLLTYKARFASGFTVTAVSSKSNNLRGHGGLFILDEFAHMLDPEGVFKAAIRSRARLGRIIIISTHSGEDSYFNFLITEANKGRNKFSVHRIDIHDAVNDGMYRQICRDAGVKWTKEGEEEYVKELLALPGSAEEFECVPSSGEDDYFKQSTLTACISPLCRVIPLHLEAKFVDDYTPAERNAFILEWFAQNLEGPLRAEFSEGISYMGQDFARAPKGALSIVAYGRKNKFNTVLEARILLEMRGVPVDQQIKLAELSIRCMHNMQKFMIDATGNGLSLGEKMGDLFGKTRCEALTINEKAYAEMMPPLRSALEKREILIPADEDTLRDFRKVKTKQGKPVLPQLKMKTGGYRHGDAVVAVMLLNAAARIHVPIDYERVPGYRKNARSRQMQ